MRDTLTVGEVADRIGLKKSTVYVMSARGELPEPDEIKNADAARPTKLWYASTIDRWNRKRPKR